MEFSDLTMDRIGMFNKIFFELDIPTLFDNIDIVIDKDSLSFRHIIFAIYVENKTTIPLTVMIEEDSIRLDVCNLPETFEWSKSDIKDERDEIIEFFKKLLTSFVLVEGCGSLHRKSRMYLFDEQGVFIEKYILRGFAHSYTGWNCDKQMFFPLYPRGSD